MSWFIYVIRCDTGVDRNGLMQYLKDNGIPSRPYFTPIRLQTFYQQRFGNQFRDLRHTEQAGDSFLTLPFSSVMTETQVTYVFEQIRM